MPPSIVFFADFIIEYKGIHVNNLTGIVRLMPCFGHDLFSQSKNMPASNAPDFTQDHRILDFFILRKQEHLRNDFGGFGIIIGKRKENFPSVL